ncbi:MAG: hypothetical protein BJ554DRAFT_6900 [Olpidium bornovanus]|uniref:Uncharacterized protein n=1 Tax=Olpidium bornovanus TaxID=278681 RepID=A0A8H7ZXG9_9FUNG|nr:MAG: hypothetical protein BJ554DRAFT_6900 [Olpidium bornovanus]
MRAAISSLSTKSFSAGALPVLLYFGTAPKNVRAKGLFSGHFSESSSSREKALVIIFHAHWLACVTLGVCDGPPRRGPEDCWCGGAELRRRARASGTGSCARRNPTTPL